MHYYQFNIGDYRKDTAHLSVVEHYIYRQLIDWYYLDEKPIPLKTRSVIRRLSLGNNAMEELQNVLDDFFEKDKTGYVHGKIENEIEKYHAKVKINQENGKRGGRPIGSKDKAKRKQRKTHPVNSGNPEEPSRNPNQEPITNNQELITKEDQKQLSGKPDDVGAIFSHWQTVFDHKRAILDADRKKTIKAALKIGRTVEDIKLAIDGCSVTPHNIGQNDRGQVYDGLHIILSNKNFDRFVQNAESPPTGKADSHQFDQSNYGKTEIPSWMS